MKNISIPGTPFAVICRSDRDINVVIDFLAKIYPDYILSKPSIPSRTDTVCGFIGGRPTYDFAMSHPDLETISFGEFYHHKIESEYIKTYSREEVIKIAHLAFKEGYEITAEGYNNEISPYDEHFEGDQTFNDWVKNNIE